ncbi:MAG TPA: ISAs1 family transposase [Porphyromonadaceae bacterium]|nr:ISAs1 family transposase [Porphyromonadaceae bacterium]
MAQVYIDHKSNEINAIKVLLEQIELKDTLISIDAIGTQTAIAEQIKEKGGKYLLGVKSNQKHTLQEVESYFCLLYKKHIMRFCLVGVICSPL